MNMQFRGSRSAVLSLALATSALAAPSAPYAPVTVAPLAQERAPTGGPTGGPTEAPKDGPWRLAESLGLPDWFQIKGTIRGRYETFDDQFRGAEGGEARIFVTRSLVEMTVKNRFLSATAELQDSRAYSGISNARLNTGIVNTVELLQGYIAGEFTDAFAPDDSLRVQLGRHTMDIGSRRLVARNRFRNTINAFTGVNAQWKSSKSGANARLFYTIPVQRLPRNPAALEAGDIEFDEERTNVRFWGGHGAIPGIFPGMDAELYFFGLDESDAEGLLTRDRKINTVGTRWLKPRVAGDLYWELESIYQFGKAPRSSAATFDHEAWFYHLNLGYTFKGEKKSRLEALFDYASGDKNPNDTKSNRFDTLFGARRFEFGPTGIFGAFARSNLVSPGLRFVTKPATDWELMLSHRFNYLASDRDAWTTAGVQDPTGDSGSFFGPFIGTLSEFRVRHDIAPKSLRLEFGVAYFAAGSFVADASRLVSVSDSLYGYTQLNFTF